MPEPKVQRLLRVAPIASRRRCPLKPWGPAGGNGFWGNPQEGAQQHSHVRGRLILYSLSTPYTPSECCMNSRVTPKPKGTGQKCSMAGGICPPLNICAPKPRRNVFGGYPCFTPSPLVSIRSWFGYINAQFDKACLNTMCPFSETELRAAQPNLHRGRVFAHACKSRRAK